MKTLPPKKSPISYENRYGPSAYAQRVLAPVRGFQKHEEYVEPPRKYAGKVFRNI